MFINSSPAVYDDKRGKPEEDTPKNGKVINHSKHMCIHTHTHTHARTYTQTNKNTTKAHALPKCHSDKQNRHK